MALPTLFSLEECSSYTKTVAPFLPQLYALPEKVAQVVAARGQGFTDLYLDTNPLVSGFAFSIFLGAVFLVAAEINQNFSQVDRFWSLLPTFYIAHFDLWAHLAGVPSQRVDAALLFGTIWSARLTFNYWRKGGYQAGSEDYRWAIIKKNIGPVLFHLLNWTFISFIQSVLLFAVASPTYILLLTAQFEPEITTADMGFVAAEVALVAIECVADQQQWNYQSAKKKYQQNARVPQGYTQSDLDRGFITSGMWALSRHPNFAAEQTIWALLYQWSCFASRSMWCGWAAVGPSALIALVQGSTWFTELISTSKYPDYVQYKKLVGMFVPFAGRLYEGGVGSELKRRQVREGAAKETKVIRTSELEEKLKRKKMKQK